MDKERNTIVNIAQRPACFFLFHFCTNRNMSPANTATMNLPKRTTVLSPALVTQPGGATKKVLATPRMKTGTCINRPQIFFALANQFWLVRLADITDAPSELRYWQMNYSFRFAILSNACWLTSTYRL